MSPKSLLRHPQCISTLEDLATGAFEPVISETDKDIEAASVRRVVLCSGKLYYELRAARRARGIKDIALVRLDQLYPVPAEALRTEVARYGDVEVVWAQEEPRNMGAWPMMDEWLAEALGGVVPRYVGRPAAAATATGFPGKHKAQQESVLSDALGT